MKKRIVLIMAIVLVVATLATVLLGCTPFINVGKQVDILTELRAGTADIGVMDFVMADYYTGLEANKDLMVVDLNCEDEFYAVGMRKNDLATVYMINKALYAVQENGKLDEIAKKYNLDGLLTPIEEPVAVTDMADWEKVIAKTKITIGYTKFEPIAYFNEDKKFVGFDTELAEAVFAELGLGDKLKFQEIEWATKETELNAGTIDLIWNGFTVSEERKENLAFSSSYMKNKQVAVIRVADFEKFSTLEKIKEMAKKTGKEKIKLAAERGSAGASVIKDIILK